MTPGVRQFLVSSTVLVALIAVAGCSHYLLAEREPWRHEAELACINSGVPEETAGRVRIAAISGPGACGIDYPLKVSELGESRPLGYDDEAPVPPASIPNASMPHWPVVQSDTLPPLQAASPPPSAPPYGQQPYGQQPYGQPQYGAPHDAPPPSQPAPYGQTQYRQPQYGAPQYGAPSYGQPRYASPQPYGSSQAVAPQAGAPISLSPPGVSPSEEDDPDGPDGAPHPYYNPPNYGAPSAAPVEVPASLYSPRPMMAPPGAQQALPSGSQAIAPLGPPAAPMMTASAGPVEVKPAATLACPIVSVLDKWISAAVQPAALKWFHQPVVEIKQISAYSCRGMNGNPNAHISEHAFGNALDIAEFDLADGHRISVQYGWRGSPEEQGFLHDVQGAACQDFTTVLAPGANVYHYNHIHVDLMRRAGRPYICEPTAIPGEVAAARARTRYAARHDAPPGVTGAIRSKPSPTPLGYLNDDDRLPEAVPGDD